MNSCYIPIKLNMNSCYIPIKLNMNSCYIPIKYNIVVMLTNRFHVIISYLGDIFHRIKYKYLLND